MAKLCLKNFIPKAIGFGKNNCQYGLHCAFNKIPILKRKIKNEEIGVWYETRTPTDGKVIHYQIFPKFIYEDKELYESIGLYYAEGGMNPNCIFNFSNNEPKIINTFMRSFRKQFGIPFSNWSWSIYFNDKLRKNENKNTTQQREGASINFWLEKTKIKPEMAAKITCRYSNKGSRGKLRTKKKWGSLNIGFGNRILKTLWLNIMRKLIEKTLQERNKNRAASILRGWIAGDGCCEYAIYSKVKRGLGITCKDRQKTQIIFELFNILGIKPYKEKNGLRFTKAEYLIKAYNYKLTTLHLQKFRNLLKSLLSYKRLLESIKGLNLKRIKAELNEVEEKIKKRKGLFEKLKTKKLPRLKEKIDWHFLINGLFLKYQINCKEFKKELGCSESMPGKWLNGKVEPSRKYKSKILKKIKDYNREGLTNIGQLFLKTNWGYVLEGLQIFFKASRRELARKIRIHPNTIESAINQRSRLSRETVSKILNLIKRNKKTPKEILQIYEKSKKIDWSDLIKRILIENEWSQRELAEKLDCSRSLVREWLRGLEPVNKYKGKLLEIPKYFGKTKINFKSIIKRALETYTLLDLKKKLNVSVKTIKDWKSLRKIQPRHIKRIIRLKENLILTPVKTNLAIFQNFKKLFGSQI